MFFHPSPGGVLVAEGLVVLFNGANTGASMSEAASLFATRHYVFQVVHSSISWGWGLTERIAVTGPEPEAFEAAWRAFLSQDDVTVSQVEQTLLGSIEPDRVVDLTTVAKHKVGVGALNNGFYWKPEGAWTWRGVALRSTSAAQTLQDFFAGRLGTISAPRSASDSGATRFAPGAAVVVHWTDGKSYPATVVRPESTGHTVEFEGGRREWVPEGHLEILVDVVDER